MTNRTKLTTTVVDRLREPGIWWDTQTPGLGCRVSEKGTKAWFYKRRVKGSGVERNVSLGRHGDPVLLPDGTLRSHPFGAEDARAKAAAVQAQLLAGIDPVQKRKDAEAAAVVQAEENKALTTTLREVMLEYLSEARTKHGPLRAATVNDYKAFMERHFKIELDQPVAGITRDQCVAKFTEIEQKSTSQAHKAQVYLNVFIAYAREKYATDKGYPILEVNPVKRARKLKRLHPNAPRDRRIPLGKVGAVWSMLRKRAENPVRELDRTAADWISLILLTGWRLTESGSLRWSQVNFDTKTVTLLGDVVKNHNTLIVPMSDALHDLLKARTERPKVDAEYVFPSFGEKTPYISDARGTMDAVIKIAGLHLSPHDLRRTAESIALEVRIDYSYRMRLLNHKPAGVHDSAYGNDKNPDTLRPAVQAIANYILDASKVADAQASGSNIINLADRRQA